MFTFVGIRVVPRKNDERERERREHQEHKNRPIDEWG